MSYPAHEPEPNVVPLSQAAQILQAESGPKCAECGKPSRLSKEQGGCGCSRFVRRKDNLSSSKNLTLRQTEAMERLAQLLECYLTSSGVAVPAAAPAPAEAAPVATGTVVDGFRAKHEATRKVS